MKKKNVFFFLQEELAEVARIWNGHSIRSTQNDHLVHGRPYILYNMPELYGRQNFKCDVPDGKLEVCFDECKFKSVNPCDTDLYKLCCIYMEENGWTFPHCAEDAFELYSNLREELNHVL